MKYFLFDAESMDEVDLEDSKEITLDKSIEVFYHLSEEDGSFFGLQNENGTIVQFAWEGPAEWLVDRPIDNSRTYQLYGDYDTCVNIIKSFFGGENIQRIYNMELTSV